MKKSRALLLGAWSLTMAVTALAGGSKRTGETCSEDGECSRGHCYTKQDNAKVCLDCTASEISNYRGQVQRYCKEEPRGCSDIPKSEEVPEEYFKIRIANGERCIAARDSENKTCWNGGDTGHNDAVDLAEKTKKICYDEWNTRKGNGGIYTCSDSTYSSRAADADNACTSYGNACESWSKDDKPVDCTAIEDAMKMTAKCVETVEKLNSDCLPRTSSRRDQQFGRAKKAYDVCKELLDFKKDKKLCK